MQEIKYIFDTFKLQFFGFKGQKTEYIFLPLIAHIVRAPVKSFDAKGKLKDELIKLLSSQIIHVAK